jgi:hypothetical protein
MPFVEGVHQTHSHHLAKHAVEIVGYLGGKKSPVFSRERSTRLEKVGHVERATGPIPIR